MARLIIDPAMGMAGDMFVAALVGLGAPARQVVGVMEAAARPIGGAAVTLGQEILPGGPAHRLRVALRAERHPLHLEEASRFLRDTLHAVHVGGPFLPFAVDALAALAHAEHHAHEELDHPSGHDGHATVLHEAQDIIMDLAAAAWGLQWLGIPLDSVCCRAPVRVGGGYVRFSHGRFPVPAPATTEILSHHAIPWEPGPLDFEQLTPTGAAILAALRPRYIPRSPLNGAVRQGVGLGSRITDPPNALTLSLVRFPAIMEGVEADADAPACPDEVVSR